MRRFFLCAVVIFGTNQKYAISEKSNLDLLSFSWKTLSISEVDDIQGLDIHPHPHFCNSSKILWQS